MERLEGELNRNKTSIFSASSCRMNERPFSVQSGKGRSHENFGSSFPPSKSTRPVQGKATSSKVKSATSHLMATSSERDPLSDSDDELLLSEGAPSLGSSPIRKRVVFGKPTMPTPQETNLAPNGLPYHPNFLPKPLPSFKKIKKGLRVEDSISEGSPSSSLPDPDDSQELFRPISDDLLSQTLNSQHTAKLTRKNDAGSINRTMTRVDGTLSLPANE